MSITLLGGQTSIWAIDLGNYEGVESQDDAGYGP